MLIQSLCNLKVVFYNYFSVCITVNLDGSYSPVYYRVNSYMPRIPYIISPNLSFCTANRNPPISLTSVAASTTSQLCNTEIVVHLVTSWSDVVKFCFGRIISS